MYAPSVTVAASGREIPPEPPYADAAEILELPARLPSAKTILVVEDDDGVRDLVTELLSELGCTVLMAANGHEALRIARRAGRIDLLFTDMVMPGGINGTDLADQILAERPETKVLFTSGYIYHPASSGRAIGNTEAFIEKPYRPGALIRWIETLLRD